MKITMIAGSNRNNATSTRALQYIARIMQQEQAEVRIFDLYAKPLPIYNPDQDEEADANVRMMKQWMAGADAIVLATPEYHGGISGVLKNALDYLGSEHFSDKAVLSVSSSGGAVGVSSLQQLQTIVRNLHGVNSPEWISLGGAARAFNASGEPEQQATKDRIERVTKYFLRLANSLKQATYQ